MKVRHVALIAGSVLAGTAVLTAGAIAAALVQLERRPASKPSEGSKRFLGKVVLITGSSRGLGLAIAEEFGHQGAKIVLTARNRTNSSVLVRCFLQGLRSRRIASWSCPPTCAGQERFNL